MPSRSLLFRGPILRHYEPLLSRDVVKRGWRNDICDVFKSMSSWIFLSGGHWICKRERVSCRNVEQRTERDIERVVL